MNNEMNNELINVHFIIQYSIFVAFTIPPPPLLRWLLLPKLRQEV